MGKKYIRFDMKSIDDFRGVWSSEEQQRLHRIWLEGTRNKAFADSKGKCVTKNNQGKYDECRWLRGVKEKFPGVGFKEGSGKCCLPGGYCCDSPTPRKEKKK